MLPLNPPFNPEDSIFVSSSKGSPHTPYNTSEDEKTALVLPAVFEGGHGNNSNSSISISISSTSTKSTRHGGSGGGGVLSSLVPVDSDDARRRRAFLAAELDVSRINELDRHLWLAGLQRCARPLHRQVSMGRTLVVTESADLHLLWQNERIYVKPLPAFLLSHGVWEHDLCKTVELHASALGMLLSYVWLVAHESDLRLAHQHGLLPAVVTWPRWTRIVRGVVASIVDRTGGGDGYGGVGYGGAVVNPRYRFGELRLSRINWIMRLWATRPGWSFTALVRGYHFGYTQYSSFLDRNLAWLVSFTAWVVLVLTAMQVGLATDPLKDSDAFQSVAYGFTVFAIMAPMLVLGVMALTVVVLLLFNLKYARENARNYSPFSQRKI